MRLPCVLLLPLWLVGCASGESPSEARPIDARTMSISPDTLDVQGVVLATAEIAPTGGDVRGTARLTAVAGGTRVTLTLVGLRPSTRHGVQILHGRACHSDASIHLGAAHGQAHGPVLAAPPDRHAGDLGNVRADGDGRARYDRVDPHLRLDGTASAIGRAIVVRDGVDDGVTMPGGGVLGCGIIEPSR